MSVNTLLISEQLFKERSSVHGNMDGKLIYPEIKYAQDVYIKPVLGTALFEKLQTIIADGSIQTATDYKYLVDTYVIDALVNFTLCELSLNASFQLWNKGMARKQGENTELPSMTEIMTVASGYKTRGEYYANRMKLYLLDQSSRQGKFPEYTQPGSQVDTVTPEMRNYKIPIWLGTDDERDNPWCNPGGFNGQPYKP